MDININKPQGPGEKAIGCLVLKTRTLKMTIAGRQRSRRMTLALWRWSRRSRRKSRRHWHCGGGGQGPGGGRLDCGRESGRRRQLFTSSVPGVWNSSVPGTVDQGRTARSDNAFEDFQRPGPQLIMDLRSDETLWTSSKKQKRICGMNVKMSFE